MASTTLGERLTEQHKRQQEAIRAATLRDLLRLWPMLDKARVSDTQQAYMRAVRLLVKDARRQSALVSASYYAAYRRAEGVDSPYSPLMFSEIVDDVLETTLRVTGPVAFKRAVAAGKATEAASSIALVMQAGAVGRLVLDAGRDTIGENMEADKYVIGWQRVTDGKACYFCAMLAGRGAVYRDQESALYRGSSGRKYHDHCGCSVEPMYNTDSVSRRNRQYAEQWQEATKGKSGNDAIKAFRSAMSS